jgi:dihydrodipicolinate synthase/N-acetylneuraminate lyase
MITGKHVSRLSGYASALPTPFDENGNVDEAAFELLRRHAPRWRMPGGY